MFGFIADILTSITSILFPVFASYKALRTSDPALLTPWLMYWTTLSLFLMAESQFHFILCWVPFYSWIRFGVHLYLVLPGKQGSVFIYQTYIHPFLEEHEKNIDKMISEGHAKAKTAGVDVVRQAIEYIRVNLLNQAPKPPTPPPSRNVSYSSALLSRFSMPAARAGATSLNPSDVFSLLGKAMQQTTYPESQSRDAQAADLTASGTLIPQSLTGAERTDFVNTQRERLRTLLQAFDNEAFHADGGASSSAQPRSETPRQPSSRKSYLAPTDSTYMHKSRSESEFEDLAYETMPDPDHYRNTSRDSHSRDGKEGAGWSKWVWGDYGEKDSAMRKDR
ncbi:hypothetical protein AMS68_000595 [Peltaster fructicola]|uniref:Protein YOP1 n=1 Tax=Peltaster fructicola TaxID=286661 RepID=A0A6H0XKB4_9PEZI|nr:hypothetical protein AMS68_000595 [Peltaster fructicola]